MAYSTILTALALCLVVMTVEANECSEGLSKWFIPYGSKVGDTEDTTRATLVLKDVQFNAFGHSYPGGIKINQGTNGSFGSVRVFPMDGQKTAGTFEIRASRLPYTLTENSYVGRRVTKNKKQLKHLASIINQAYPCATATEFAPLNAYVGTFMCVKSGKKEDTFQLAVTTDGARTYVILVFHSVLTKAESQFGILDTVYPHTYKLSLEREDSGRNLAKKTNGLHAGVWVYDVTGDEPVTPPPCGKTPFECVVSEYGYVNTFLDTPNPVTGKRATLAKSKLPKESHCNFQILGVMKNSGQLKYLMVRLGNDNNKLARTYILEQKAGKVMVRGTGIPSGSVKVTYPHQWTHGGTSITLTESTVGYVLSSATCSYQIEFRPRGDEPRVKVTVGNEYADKMSGQCKNFDGDFE